MAEEEPEWKWLNFYEYSVAGRLRGDANLMDTFYRSLDLFFFYFLPTRYYIYSTYERIHFRFSCYYMKSIRILEHKTISMILNRVELLMACKSYQEYQFYYTLRT